MLGGKHCIVLDIVGPMTRSGCLLEKGFVVLTPGAVVRNTEASVYGMNSYCSCKTSGVCTVLAYQSNTCDTRQR